MSAEFLSPETKEVIKFIASILEIIAIGGSFLIVAYRLMLPYVQNNGKFTIKWFAIQQINLMMHDIETTKRFSNHTHFLIARAACCVMIWIFAATNFAIYRLLGYDWSGYLKVFNDPVGNLSGTIHLVGGWVGTFLLITIGYPIFLLAFPAQLEISRMKVMNLAKRAALPDDEVRSILHRIQP